MKKIKVRKLDKNDNFNGNKIPLKFSIDTLNIVISYIVSNSDTITRGNLFNVRKLFNMIDENYYNDYQSEARLKFIKRALKLKLEEYMENPKIILDACRSEKYADVDDDIIDDITSLTLSNNEIKYVNSMTSDKLSYSYYFKYKDNIVDLIRRLENGEYESYRDISFLLKREISALLGDIRRTEQLDNDGQMFNLSEEMFESVVTRTVKKLQSPSNQLKTSMQAFNETLNGGLENSRAYLLLGLSGGFKSGTMLNLAWQLKQSNQNFKTKDSGKTPTVLFITHENTVYETVERLFALCVAEDIDDTMKNYSPKEVIKLLKTKGGLKITKENNIDIYITYQTGGCDTSMVRDLIDELEEDNREIIAVFHDYIKKIHSVRPAKDLRIELGYVMDEFKEIAVEKDIPFVTASQLNRDAARTIDASIECNKTDLARSLGTSNVGESWNLIENADWVGIINRERQISTDTMYLTVKRLKIRYGTDQSIDYFNHPFHENEFRLLSDIGTNCVSKKSLSDALIGVEEDNIFNFEKKGRTNSKERKEIKTIQREQRSLSDLNMLFAS